MDLSDKLKTSLRLSNNSSIINDQTYKTLLQCSFSELIREETEQNIDSIQHSKPDVIKNLHASLLTVIAEFARHNLTQDSVNAILTTECNFNTSKSNLFCELYEKYKKKLQITLGNIGTHLPHVVDVKWNIDYIVKTSGIDEAEGPIFRVCLFAETYNEDKGLNEIEKINFSCTSQELQDLVYRLKEAVRHCQKIAVEH